MQAFWRFIWEGPGGALDACRILSSESCSRGTSESSRGAPGIKTAEEGGQDPGEVHEVDDDSPGDTGKGGDETSVSLMPAGQE